MTLHYPTVIDQVKRAGRVMADQFRADLARLPLAQSRLLELGEQAPNDIQRKIELAGERWHGAVPTDEDPSGRLPVPAQAKELHVLAADGSQIHPDRHSGLAYALINIGSIHVEHGSERSPVTGSSPFLFFRREDLHDSSGSPVSSALLHGRRDVAEMAALADMAEVRQGEPTLALLDNGLILWLALQDRDRRTVDVDRLVQAYLGELDRLREYGTPIAGVIDRPRHASVLRLLHLAQLEQAGIDEQMFKNHEFQGLADRQLFSEVLQPGQRSARFVYKTHGSLEFEERRHTVQFFYLRIGSRILRVEIPAWVGDSQELVDRAHAGIVQEANSTGGYPYALARAHELALVTHQDRMSLENLLRGELAGRGFRPRPSTKATTKGWLSGRRRHTL